MRFRFPVALVAISTIAACRGSDGGTTTIRSVARVTVAGVNTTLNPGQTTQLTATAADASGAMITSPGTVVWTSASTTVATVDQSGRVTAVSAGTAAITADIAGVKGSISIKVNLAAAASKDTIFTLPTQWSPAFVTINVGESVTFVFGGGIVHNAIFSKFNVSGSPADIGNFANQTFVRTFNTKGRFPFECTLHDGMVGEITVQ